LPFVGSVSLLSVTDDASIILTILSGIHATWCGNDLGRDVVDEQIDLGLLERLALRIDAVEAELARRGL
jgi:hypothetical protein